MLFFHCITNYVRMQQRAEHKKTSLVKRSSWDKCSKSSSNWKSLHWGFAPVTTKMTTDLNQTFLSFKADKDNITHFSKLPSIILFYCYCVPPAVHAWSTCQQDGNFIRIYKISRYIRQEDFFFNVSIVTNHSDKDSYTTVELAISLSLNISLTIIMQRSDRLWCISCKTLQGCVMGCAAKTYQI